MSKHGGSEASGLVVPIGLEALKPETPAGKVLVPQEVVDARKQAAERTARAIQLARRSMALELLKGSTYGVPNPEAITNDVANALKYADALMDATGGGI